MYTKIIKQVSNTSHQNVCWRFKNISDQIVDIYEYDKKLGSKIFLKFDDMLCLKEYSIVISKLLNYKWAQLLENFNFSPKIVSKVNGISNAKPKMKNSSKYKEELLKQFDGKEINFYIGKESALMIFNHVIPWSYVYLDNNMESSFNI